MTYYLKYLLSTELRFDAILYSKLTNENSDTGHIKCSCGRRFPTPELDVTFINANTYQIGPPNEDRQVFFRSMQHVLAAK